MFKGIALSGGDRPCATLPSLALVYVTVYSRSRASAKGALGMYNIYPRAHKAYPGQGKSEMYIRSLHVGYTLRLGYKRAP